jgi:hypothetical protein
MSLCIHTGNAAQPASWIRAQPGVQHLTCLHLRLHLACHVAGCCQVAVLNGGTGEHQPVASSSACSSMSRYVFRELQRETRERAALASARGKPARNKVYTCTVLFPAGGPFLPCLSEPVQSIDYRERRKKRPASRK